jgi:hypothetical protein
MIVDIAIAFYERYPNVRFATKRDVERVCASPSEFLAQLQHWVNAWETELLELEGLAPKLHAADFEQQQENPDTLRLGVLALQLMDTLECVAFSIGPPQFESLQQEVKTEIGRLLDDMRMMLEYYVPDKKPAYLLDAIIQVFPLQLQSTRLAISTVKSRLRSAELQINRPNTGRKPLRQFVSWINSKLINARIQLCLIALAVIVLLLLNRFLPSDALHGLKMDAKLFIWLVTVLWFPMLFFTGLGGGYLTSYILFSLMWVFILAPWAYGLGQGLLVAIFLAGLPLSRVVGSGGEKVDRRSRKIPKQFYVTAAFCLFLVGTVITHELIWWYSLIVWITFAFTANMSFKYFRNTFDMIQSLYPGRQAGHLRRRLHFVTLVISIVLLFPGVLPPLSHEILLSLYRDAATLAFGMIAILMAVQAIVPGITTWLQSSDPAAGIREKRTLLGISGGLEGFMRTFFLVFLIAFGGSIITAMTPADVVLARFDKDVTLVPISTLVDIMNPFYHFVYSAEWTRLGVHSSLFAVFMYFAIYSLAQLYYLFIATNTTVLPIKDALLSSPVVIENLEVQTFGLDDDAKCEMEEVGRKLHTSLSNSRRLRGEVINRLAITTTESKHGIISLVDMEMDLPSLESIIEGALEVLRCGFSVPNISHVRLRISRVDHGQSPLNHVFSIEVDRKEFDFLEKDVSGMDIEYKMEQVGAKFQRYLLPEAQIA